MSLGLNYCVEIFGSVPRGASSPERNIFQYPQTKKLINKKCDTYHVNSFCSNCELSNYQTSKVGIIRFICLGHKK